MEREVVCGLFISLRCVLLLLLYMGNVAVVAVVCVQGEVMSRVGAVAFVRCNEGKNKRTFRQGCRRGDIREKKKR